MRGGKPYLALSTLLVAAFLSGTVQAFKIHTHLWLADQLAAEIESGSVSFGELGSYAISDVVRQSIVNVPGGREAFVLGALGADLYPDLVAGQMTTHPGLPWRYDAAAVPDDVASLAQALSLPINTNARGWQTDDWLKHVRDRAFAVRRNQPSREIAFAYGYLLHAAMDVWAHTYVNLYAGDLFSIVENQEIAARHVGLETYIANVHQQVYALLQTPTTRGGNSQVLPGGISFRPAEDTLVNLKVPARFVRQTLILNHQAATQYSRTAAASHVWAMYALWESSRRTEQQWQTLRTSLNQAAQSMIGVVNEAEQAWLQAEQAKSTSASLLQDALTAQSAAQEDLREKADALDTAITNALDYLNSLPLVSATVETLDDFMDDLPPFLKDPYQTARTAHETARQAARKALDDADTALAASNAAAADALAALDALNLKKAARDALQNAAGGASGAADAVVSGWRLNIESGVDAYVRAWEEVARELMRPKGNRFKPGTDPTWPVKEWAMCWGPVFGMPALPIPPGAFASACQNTFTGYNNARESLRLNITNQILDTVPGGAALKQQILAFDEKLRQVMIVAAPMAGQMIADALPGNTDNAIPGTASFLARMMDRDVDAPRLNEEYRIDSSAKRLPVYTRSGSGSISAMLRRDGLPDGTDAGLTAMQGFPPVANAMVLSRLVLLDGEALNTLARNAGVTATGYGDGEPVYRQTARAGVVLIGAIRSIDGNHQWQPVAPVLPRGNTGRPERISEQTCRRFGYPFGNSYPGSCSGDPGYSLRKGGMRLWMDPELRREVFAKLFTGPLSPAICNKIGNGYRNAHLGIGCEVADPFPGSEPSNSAVAAYLSESTRPHLSPTSYCGGAMPRAGGRSLGRDVPLRADDTCMAPGRKRLPSHDLLPSRDGSR
ncbi:MAG TPA: hypothetical protein ENJ80_11010 [Gammaproteobacteria bacterium]|nr:hypothetical protein [Gammaproteobacteria bacterium]